MLFRIDMEIPLAVLKVGFIVIEDAAATKSGRRGSKTVPCGIPQ